MKLIPSLGRGDITISLRTEMRRVAASRARAVRLRVDGVLSQVMAGSLERAQARVLLRHLATEEPWEMSDDTELLLTKALAGDDRDTKSIMAIAREDVTSLPPDELARVLLHLRNLTDALDEHSRTAAAQGGELEKAQAAAGRIARRLSLADLTDQAGEQAAQKAATPEPVLAFYMDAYLAEKQRSTRHQKGITDNSAYQARLTARLWEEAMGALPVARVGRKEAAGFKDLLLRLPSSHGKSGTHRSIMQSIDQADAKEEAGTPVERMSMKTVKRHFSSMQQAWKWLVERGEVSANPFAGFAFPGAQSSSGDRDEWSDADLIGFLGSDYMRKAASERSRDWWLISIAMWSGMRVEEICRLRPQADVEQDDGVPLLLVEAQGAPLPEWSPKSQAGARAIPVHPMLQDAGLLALAHERRRQERLVPGLVYSPAVKKYSAQASRQMSYVKQRAGVSEDTTAFHSFRHATTTMLRNTPPDQLRAEWLDAVMGHKPGKGASTGAKVYLKKIGAGNLMRVVEAIRYPPAVEAAYRELVALSRADAYTDG